MWQRARNRATEEGVSMNQVLNEIMEGYGEGKIDLPHVTVVKTFDAGES